MKSATRRKPALFLSGLLLFLVAGFAAFHFWREPEPVARLNLGDGRILQIEAVTFGKQHSVGRDSIILKRFGPWLPASVSSFLQPKVPRSRITMPDHPGLVVWVNAVVNAGTGKSVDSQDVVLYFTDENGDSYFPTSGSWSGFGSFSREGHIFECYPRDAEKLRLNVISRKGGKVGELEIPNPAPTRAESWDGSLPPLVKKVGNFELRLSNLTNLQRPDLGLEMPNLYLQPNFEVLEGGQIQPGWQVEWTAADPIGNRGQFLGIHKPVLKFFASAYPMATNVQAALPLLTLSNIDLTLVSTQFVTLRPPSGEISTIGIFPPGMYIFSEGRFDTNPAAMMGPVRGGAPSGWVGTSMQVTPVRHKEYSGHYCNVPVIYLKRESLKTEDHLGIRLRDEKGRYWMAKPEPQGNSMGILPFMLDLPPEVKIVTPEIVVSSPLKAEFIVDTRSSDLERK
jgi:hypothetical protein